MTWLEDNHNRYWFKEFRDSDDIPVKYEPPVGACLWTTFMARKTRVIARDDVDFDKADIVTQSLITNAVDLETEDIPAGIIKSVAELLKPSSRSQNTSSDSRETSIWTYERALNTIVTGKEVLVTWTFNTRHQLTVALTVLAHAIRMEILQNEDVQNCRAWDRFINEATCTKTRSQELILNHYNSNCTTNNIIQLLMHRCPAVKLDQFSTSFIQNFEIRITVIDKSADINHKVQSALTYKTETGLYLCEFIDSTYSSLAMNFYLPLLIRKDNICLQNVAAIYEHSSNGNLLFRLITRSRQGLCDNNYMWSQFCWNSKDNKWANKTPAGVPTGGSIFPCLLGIDYKLIACVYIPTKTQHIPLPSQFCMELSALEEHVTENWKVKDSTSLDPHFGFPLTKRVLHRMASDLMRFQHYYQSNQHVIVSDTLVDELNSLKEYLSQRKEAEAALARDPNSSSHSTSSSGSIQFSTELIHLKELLTPSEPKPGCVHLLISYKKSGDGRSRNWVYAYFLLHTKEIVIMTRRCDGVRDILNIGSCLKCFLTIVFPSVSIPFTQVLWRSRKLLGGLCGYYAFKQFWKHAEMIKNSVGSNSSRNSSLISYMRVILEYHGDERKAVPSWCLGEITSRQLTQVVKDVKNGISTSSESSYFPAFLLKN
jgi:hypothetical protein